MVLGGVVAAEGGVDPRADAADRVGWPPLPGDLASFMLGRRLGRRFLVTPRAAHRRDRPAARAVLSFFDRHGAKAILVGRFVGIIRAVAPFLAGSSGMRLRAFLPWSLLGTAAWARDVHAGRLRVPRVVQLRGRSGRAPHACRCRRRRAGARVPGAPPATIPCMTTGDAAHDAQRGWMPWLIGALVLPALGAAAVVALVEGVDLASWAEWQAAAAIGALFAVPAVLSAVVARRFGAVEALAWAFACAGVQLALVFGVGFLALGLGPG